MKLKKDRIEVEFITLIMGSGKTSVTIKEFNRLPDEKFLYVTPFIKETERITNECINFVYPTDAAGTKSMSFDKLVSSGKRIATTHELFLGLNKEDYSMFADYTLILDEVIAGVEDLKITKKDVGYLLDNPSLVKFNDDNSVKWVDADYDGRFNDLKESVEKGGVVLVNNSAVAKEFPIEIFESFKKASVMTYHAEASLLYHYFLGKGIIPRIVYRDSKVEAQRITEFKKLITVYQGKHIYKRIKPTLSVSWYEKATTGQLNNIENKVRGFFNSIDVPKELTLFSTFADYEEKINVQRHLPEHIAHNTRATNEYREYIALSYTVNRRINPVIDRYFKQNGVVIFNEDAWSLSELIQVIWRLRIREDKPIYVQILSKRMRDLFMDWLDNKRPTTKQFCEDVAQEFL